MTIATSARIPAKENESERKQNGFLSLSFAFFWFSESGLFKGLQPKKAKKFAWLPTRAPGCNRDISNSHTFPSPACGPGAERKRFRLT
jgi:hypothetical protein